MENQSHSFLTGLFVILLGLAVIAGAIFLGPPKGPTQLPIDLVTNHNVVGLKVGAPVRFRGVDVGRVDSIAFDSAHVGQIRVRVVVDQSAPITRSTYAKLSYQGITGVAFIQLDDDRAKAGEPLPLSTTKVAQMELQASFLERAEDDARDVVSKVAHVAARVEELLSDENQKRLMAAVDSLKQSADRYGTLAQELEPTAKALPAFVQQASRTVERVQGAVDTVGKLAQNVDSKLTVVDTLELAARQVGRAADDLHRETVPRMNAMMDEVTVDARELRRTLHQANAHPQSFIFGVQPSPPGPGERGFIATKGATK